MHGLRFHLPTGFRCERERGRESEKITICSMTAYCNIIMQLTINLQACECDHTVRMQYLKPASASLMNAISS